MEVRPFGDAALQIVVGRAGDPATLSRVHALAARVAAARTAGEPWGTPVPGMATLLVPFDVRVLSTTEASDRLSRIASVPDAAEDARPPEARSHRIEVRYGGDDGPDLAAVAGRLGVAPGRVVELHASVTYRVGILGFMPGFAYLGELPDELRLPRRDTPRARVPAGSVAIAERHTAVYPFETPGGWHLIGRTDAQLWQADRDPPALLRPGDLVRFEPVA